MRRVRGALHSLRWRLTLTYVALLALLLAGLGAFQYLTLQRSLVDTRVSSLEDDLKVGLRSGFPLLGTGAKPGATRAGLERAAVVRAFCTGTALSAGEFALESGAARAFADRVHGYSGISVVIFDHSLIPLGHNTDAAEENLPQVDTSALQTALRGHSSSPQVVDTPTGGQLAVALPLAASSGTVCGVAQLATSTQPIDDVLAHERVLLVLGGGTVLVVALLLGLFLTSRALTPLRRLTDTSRALAGGDLRARSRLQPRADEVGTLAESFDEMADRIEDAFTTQAELQARMRRFIADASHELRTPVTALKGYIDVLRRGASREPAALDAALESMGREAERMRMLVLDLLTLARLDAMRPLTLEALDLNQVVGSVLDEGVPGMPAVVERDFAESPLLVTADHNAVMAMTRNLLVNSCKYAPGARQVWSTGRQQGRARFSVHDEGPGIPAADLPHVFERFYRGEKTRAREEGGSGLGLSIVQGLARALGGDAEIHSVEGSGTTATVWLPLAEHPRAVEAA